MGRIWLSGVSALVLATEAVSAPSSGSADGSEAIRTALAQHDLSGAAEKLDALVEARLPAKVTGKPDPVLDRLFADYFSAQGQIGPARILLRRVVADPATPDPVHYRLLLATALEGTGEWADARQIYDRIAADPKAAPDLTLSARLGLARIQMAADPKAAMAALAAIDAGAIPTERAWEVDLLAARAASMAESDMAATARTALNKAWVEAPAAAIGDSAVARIAGDQALAAGRAGDRRTLITMLAVDRSVRNPNTGQQLVVNDLPVCGIAGITPQDIVSIAVDHQPVAGRPAVTLAWASRPGIAQTFLIAVQKSGGLSVPDGQVATFNLRCRTTPSSDYVLHTAIEEDATGWMTARGAYPNAAGYGRDGAPSFATKLAQRQARYGANSLMVLPLLTGAMNPGALNLGDPEGRRLAQANADQVQTILDHGDAPAWMKLTAQMATIGIAVLAQTKTETQGQTEIQALLAKAASDPALPLDTLYMLTSMTAQSPTLPRAFKATMLSAAIDILKRKVQPGDQRLSALALRLYSLRQDTGDTAGAAEVIALVPLPPLACALSDPGTHYVSSNITADDYPSDLNFMTVSGVSQVEFDLDAGGKAQNGRLLLEDPPYAFNAIAAERIPTIRYDSPRIAGKVAACRGQYQSIRWQSPNSSYDF